MTFLVQFWFGFVYVCVCLPPHIETYTQYQYKNIYSGIINILEFEQ